MAVNLFTGRKGFEVYENKKPPNKRVRYLVPTYIKFYSVFQYDREKFRKLLNEWLSTEDGQKRTYETLKKKQNEILKCCYVKDFSKRPLRDSDENHIFRIGALQKIHEKIYNLIGVDLFRVETYEKDGLLVHPDEQQAEVKDTWQMPIKDRVIIHLRLLRLLRKGLSIKEAICQIKK